MNDGTKAPRNLLSAKGLALTVPLGVLFLVQTLVIKAWQVTQSEGGVHVGSVLRAWSSDAAFAVLAVLLFGVGLSFFRRAAARVALIVCFCLIMAYALVITAASHGYFLSTGSNLSWGPIGFWLSDMGTTNRIMRSEPVFAKVMALNLVHGVLVVVCAVLPHVGPIRRRIGRAKPISRNKGRAAVLGGLVLFAALVFVPAPGGSAMALSRCIPVYIPVNFAQDKFGAPDSRDAEQLEDLLEFEQEPDGPRPNIVLIIFEALNWKSSDVYFPGKNTTPFLAELAPKGAVVEHYYGVVPHTTKALVPIICGIYPYLVTEPRESEPGALPRRCIPHVLHTLDYQTAFFQPARNFENRSQLVSNLGYDLFMNYKEMPQQGFVSLNYLGKEDKIMVNPSMQWIDSLDGGPFFLTYLTLSTHHNYMTPPSFDAVDYPVETNNQSNYLNAVRYTDEFVRDVFQGLEERGLLDNTILIVVGDHGEAFGEHGRGQHDLIIWEEGLRALAVIYGPKYVPAGMKIKGFRSHLDLAPTLFHLLGLKLKRGRLYGESLFDPVPDTRALYFSCWFKNQCLAMRQGPLKTVYHFDMRDMEVYDNASDPFDEHDLAGKGAYGAAFLEERKDRMLRWMNRVNGWYERRTERLGAGQITLDRPRVANRLKARLGGYIELVGYEISPDVAVAGQDIQIKYVFKCLKEMPETYKLDFLVKQDKRRINADHVPVYGKHPLHKWKPGQYVIDEHSVHIPGNRKTGDAEISLGLEDEFIGQRLPIFQTSARVADGRVLIAKIPVHAMVKKTELDDAERREKVKHLISSDPPPFEKKMKITFGGRIRLVGVTLRHADVALGGTVEMDYVFRVLKEIPEKWKVSVYLVKENVGDKKREKSDEKSGKADDKKSAKTRAIRADHEPNAGLYTTDLWKKGEYVVDRHALYISLSKKKLGTYSVWLGFRKGTKPVPAKGKAEFDDKSRVKIGTVTISKPKIQMGRKM